MIFAFLIAYASARPQFGFLEELERDIEIGVERGAEIGAEIAVERDIERLEGGFGGGFNGRGGYRGKPMSCSLYKSSNILLESISFHRALLLRTTRIALTFLDLYKI